jgi:xylose isomerase
VKSAFWLVKFLEEVGYDGPRHFDAHAYRTEDYAGVVDFARGCMRTYLILRERAKQWCADREIQSLVASLPGMTAGREGDEPPDFSSYSPRSRDALLAASFDRAALAKRGLAYERLDQLTMDVLLGAR